MTPNIYILIISFISLYFCVSEFKRGWMPATCNLVTRLHTNWLNFLILAWLLFTLALIGSSIFEILHRITPILKPISPGAQSILRGYCVHGLLLIALILFVTKLEFWIGNLGFHQLSFRNSLLRGASGFFSAIPLIWITSAIWSHLLELLHKWNLLPKSPHQEMVSFLMESQAVMPFLGSFILSVVLAPIIEEMMFRGILYRFLKDKLPINFALIVSAIVFAFVHHNLLTFAPLIVVGILLARTYEQTGDIKANMIFHALFNLNTLILIVLQYHANTPSL